MKRIAATHMSFSTFISSPKSQSQRRRFATRQPGRGAISRRDSTLGLGWLLRELRGSLGRLLGVLLRLVGIRPGWGRELLRLLVLLLLLWWHLLLLLRVCLERRGLADVLRLVWLLGTGSGAGLEAAGPRCAGALVDFEEGQDCAEGLGGFSQVSGLGRRRRRGGKKGREGAGGLGNAIGLVELLTEEGTRGDEEGPDDGAHGSSALDAVEAAGDVARQEGPLGETAENAVVVVEERGARGGVCAERPGCEPPHER